VAGEYASSKVVGTQIPIQLGSLRPIDGKKWRNWMTSHDSLQLFITKQVSYIRSIQ
jgi:hypothetical protein